MKTLFQMKNPHEWQWGQRHIDPEHVMCCKQKEVKLRALTIHPEYSHEILA